MNTGAHTIPAPRHGQPVDASSEAKRFDVIVIGAGQAGLSVGYYLARQGVRFLILEGRDRVGDIWRSRWDSLRLFSPARFDGLPGMRFPLPGHHFPTRDQMAGYLEAYVTKMDLPVLTGIKVDGVWPAEGDRGGYVITAGTRRFEAAQVVVASGAYKDPRVPEFAVELDPSIRQLHSSEYRNISQFKDGPVLVVGASNSGTEIALEAARGHRTILSGRDPGHVPFNIDGFAARGIIPILRFLAVHAFKVDNPIGRKMRPYVRAHGGPTVRFKPADLAAAGVERAFHRTVGTRNGMPVLDGGRVLEVSNVVWATGFRKDFGWIHLPIVGDDGYPVQERGVVTGAPGLYFVGLPFLYAFSSVLITGAARDAKYVAERVGVFS